MAAWVQTGGATLAGNKQADIVVAAIRLFHEKGYHATSMQDMADAVGLQKGSLYHYISSKEDLLVVIIHDAIAQYNARLTEVIAKEISVRLKLELAVRNHLVGIAENLGMLTIFLRESYALNPDQQRLISEESNRYNQMFEELYREGVAAGELRPLDPKLATRTVLGACNWFYRWYRPGGTKSIDELTTFFVDLLFNGIAAVPTA
jgi:TetR/AcrR family transcriptional regulator, cholesterol catabolism regulator